MTRLVILFALLLSAAPAVAQEPEIISGPAVALDGDTLLIWPEPSQDLPKGATLVPVKVRIFGIDAPEMRDWPFGAYARAALDGILQDAPANCQIVDRDSHKRPVGICLNFAGTDLGSAMIGRGQAVAYRIFTYAAGAPVGVGARYDGVEADARAARRGIWRDYDGQ